jgi:hypothetical protein
MTSLNLFALTNDPESRVSRFSLSQDVQAELSIYLRQQEEQFLRNAQENIPFDGKYKPDDGECLVIENYDDIDVLTDAIEAPLSVPEIEPDLSEFTTIKALFSGYKKPDLIAHDAHPQMK